MNARPTGDVDDLPRFERFVVLAQLLAAGLGFALLASWVLRGRAADVPRLEIVTVAVATGIGVLLALHSTRRLRDMLLHSRRSEAELRAAGDLLRGHHHLLETVFEGTTDHVYLKDADGRYLLINEAAVQWLGTARSDILGRADHDLLDAEEGAEVTGIDARILETGESVTYEHAMSLAGDERTYLTTKGVFRNERGGVAGLFGISRDITERKQSEDQLRQAQKMEAVGRLAGGVAHDFNNVLTAITGYSELTMDALPAGDPIRLEVREIQLGADRAAALTRQLLAFSRRQVLQPEVVDPTAVIAGIEPMLRRLIPAGIDLRVIGDAGLGRVRVDRRQLEQIVVNLALNARDAMPAGGRLTVETSNVDLDEQSIGSHPGVVPGPYVLLAVTDTGVGMSEEMQGHLFEPFFTTKTAATGTGLGLATVYGSVSQAGGHVWVTSQPGIGSKFKILLPRVDAPLPVPEVLTESAPVGDAGTILVVEDEPVLRALMQSVLTRAGYDVILAPDGEEGLRQAHASLDRIDLVLTDVVMPVMGGPALAEAVHGLRPGMPVLFMSGFPDNAMGRDGLLDPSWAFIGKPFTPAELLERIRDLLGAVPA